MSLGRYICKFCGRGFLTHPWERNAYVNACRRAACEKAAGIYDPVARGIVERREQRKLVKMGEGEV